MKPRIELRLPYVAALRSGVHQGYWPGGVAFDFRLLKIELATYAEELGAFAGQRADRRYVGQVSLGVVH